MNSALEVDNKPVVSIRALLETTFDSFLDNPVVEAEKIGLVLCKQEYSNEFERKQVEQALLLWQVLTSVENGFYALWFDSVKSEIKWSGDYDNVVQIHSKMIKKSLPTRLACARISLGNRYIQAACLFHLLPDRVLQACLTNYSLAYQNPERFIVGLTDDQLITLEAHYKTFSNN